MHGAIDTNYKVMGFSIYEQGEGMGSSTPTSSARFARAKNLSVKNAIKNNIFYTKFDYTQLRTMEKLMKNVYTIVWCLLKIWCEVRSWTFSSNLFEVELTRCYRALHFTRSSILLQYFVGSSGEFTNTLKVKFRKCDSAKMKIAK